eukprot:6793840-Karenia_brevis.AAC.1
MPGLICLDPPELLRAAVPRPWASSIKMGRRTLPGFRAKAHTEIQLCGNVRQLGIAKWGVYFKREGG